MKINALIHYHRSNSDTNIYTEDWEGEMGTESKRGRQGDREGEQEIRLIAEM